MPTPLPIETIEHILSFLDGDVHTIAACSLVCRALLPACRTLLWHDITIHNKLKGDPRGNEELWALSEVFAFNPTIRPFVRSFTLHYDPSSGKRRTGIMLSLGYVVGYCKIFPNLRSLTLGGLAPNSCFSSLLGLIDDIPTLEEYHLRDIRPVYPSDTPPIDEPPSYGLPSAEQLRVMGASPTRNDAGEDITVQPHLRAFSIVNSESIVAWVVSELPELISSLERSRYSSTLRSLELRIGVHCGSSAQGWGPDVSFHSKPHLRVPSFAPQLSHFGIVFNHFVRADGYIDAPTTREYMQYVFSNLAQCSVLRSLCLQTSCSTAWGWVDHDGLHRPPQREKPKLPPIFLNELSHFLGAIGSPPFPALEQLSLVFLVPLAWLWDSGSAFSRLADVCLETDESGRRRYPRLTHLGIHVMLAGYLKPPYYPWVLKQEQARFVQDRDDILLPMLAPFVQGGMAVEVTAV
ncbi:hypothetical protein C8Q73DRAFT_178171 [Cubamyces lactineus]|nr:hypothetical protein C8Q73DRAFT_178171 [Cubamyces lactineus]